VCFHPTLTRFLRSIFDTAAVAHQQLLFQRSNQHPLHQDTSVVCLEKPLWMVASWIALEDVVPGRGELTYYEGSHKIPHTFFSDGTKRLNAKRDDEKAVQRTLLERCERLGLPKRDLIARKGDVFLWAADLVHGSNPRTRPEEETRMSLVTHYHPESTEPFWFRFYPDNRGTVRYDDDALYESMYYALPPREAMPRPNYRIEV
jgi:ectoine hydroxylase-related dioxygenase (phytanoyl-CoA dioxygenase family)